MKINGLGKTLFGAAVASLALFGAIQKASAHATSIGFENAGAGSVTVWMGTYGHGSDNLQGGMNLVGVMGNPFASTTLNFDTLVTGGLGNQPAGLIDGTTNFYASGNVGGGAPLLGFNPFTGVVNANNPSGFSLPTTHWQGVTFSGLGAGSYQFTYIPIANPTAEWTPWNANMNAVFDLTAVVVPTPEPGTLGLLGLGLMGLGLARRRKG